MIRLSHPSPNFGPRRDGLVPELVVIHYTGMESCDAALARLCDPAAQVSAHYLISERGEVMSLVEEKLRAWHAGAGGWAGQGDVNSRSIGVELANTGAQPFAEPQMAALERLLQGIMSRWNIPPQRVIGHSDMAPERKEDPGRRFDWRRLAMQGLSVWPEPATKGGAYVPDPAGFQAALAAFGYPEAAAETLLAAFRARFRPHAIGPLDRADMAAALDLAARFAVDAGAGNP